MIGSWQVPPFKNHIQVEELSRKDCKEIIEKCDIIIARADKVIASCKEVLECQ